MALTIITVIGNIALVLSAIVALIFGIAQVKQAERNRRERLTIDVLHDFQTREFIELFNYVYREKEQFPQTTDDLRDLPEKERLMFFQLLQQMESLGILVAEGFLDVDLLDKSLGSFITTAWKRYKPAVRLMREGDRFTAEYFQTLAEEMHERTKKNPRKPFHEMETSE